MHHTVYSHKLKEIILKVENAFERLSIVLEITSKLKSPLTKEHNLVEKVEANRLLREIDKLREAIQDIQEDIYALSQIKIVFAGEDTIIPPVINQKLATGYARSAHVHFERATKNIDKATKKINRELKPLFKSGRTELNPGKKINQKFFSYQHEIEKHLRNGLLSLESSYNHILVNQSIRHLTSSPMKMSDLKKGDVILSYKTNRYLKRHLLSWLISVAEHIRITHAALVVSADEQKVTMLAAKGGEGVGLYDLELVPGEIWFVLRPDFTEDQKTKLDSVVDKWTKEVKQYRTKIGFAELKSWVAVLIGLLHTEIVLRTNRIVMIPNLIRTKTKLFCSEVIDNIFKETGMHLVPRSIHNSVVSPAELFFSPYLNHIGILYDPKDRKDIEKEKWSI